NVALLDRATTGFARRYPEAPVAKDFQLRLGRAKRRRTVRRGLVGLATALLLMLGVWAYDARGAAQAARFQDAHADDPVAMREYWGGYQRWHPTRHLFRPEAAHAERRWLEELDQTIREGERTRRLGELRRRADDPDADPVALWADLR